MLQQFRTPNNNGIVVVDMSYVVAAESETLAYSNTTLYLRGGQCIKVTSSLEEVQDILTGENQCSQSS